MKKWFIIITIIILTTQIKAGEITISVNSEIPPIYSWTGENIYGLSILLPFKSYTYNNAKISLEVRVFPDGSILGPKVVESSGSYEIDEYAIDYVMEQYEKRFKESYPDKIVTHTVEVDFSGMDPTVWEIKAADEKGISSPVIHDILPNGAKEVMSNKFFKLKPGLKYQILITTKDGKDFIKEFTTKKIETGTDKKEVKKEIKKINSKGRLR